MRFAFPSNVKDDFMLYTRSQWKFWENWKILKILDIFWKFCKILENFEIFWKILDFFVEDFDNVWKN